MPTEICIEALLVDDDLADQVANARILATHSSGKPSSAADFAIRPT